MVMGRMTMGRTVMGRTVMGRIAAPMVASRVVAGQLVDARVLGRQAAPLTRQAPEVAAAAVALMERAVERAVA